MTTTKPTIGPVRWRIRRIRYQLRYQVLDQLLRDPQFHSYVGFSDYRRNSDEFILFAVTRTKPPGNGAFVHFGRHAYGVFLRQRGKQQ